MCLLPRQTASLAASQLRSPAAAPQALRLLAAPVFLCASFPPAANCGKLLPGTQPAAFGFELAKGCAYCPDRPPRSLLRSFARLLRHRSCELWEALIQGLALRALREVPCPPLLRGEAKAVHFHRAGVLSGPPTLRGCAGGFRQKAVNFGFSPPGSPRPAGGPQQ